MGIGSARGMGSTIVMGSSYGYGVQLWVWGPAMGMGSINHGYGPYGAHRGYEVHHGYKAQPFSGVGLNMSIGLTMGIHSVHRECWTSPNDVTSFKWHF